MSPKQFTLLIKVLSHGFASVCAAMAAPMNGFEPPKQYDFEQEIKEANYEAKKTCACACLKASFVSR